MTIRTTTWKYIRRSPYQAVAAVITMFLTFLLGGFFFLASTASAVTLAYFESKPQITVFFSDKATEKDAQALTAKLEATGKTASVKYVSKEEALKIYKEQNKNDPLLLEMVTADILPASLEVSATDPSYLKDFEPLLKGDPSVEDVIYQEDVVNSMIAWTKVIRTTGLLLAGLLAFDSLLVIVTVIGMKIALRRDEVEVLKLVGASQWYIRMPFVLEGAIYGVFGAFLAWVVLTSLILWTRPVILSVLGLIPTIGLILRDPTQTVFLASSAGFLGILVLSGLILGSLGSLLSVGRYLRFR